jgi:hypothetical protein
VYNNYDPETKKYYPNYAEHEEKRDLEQNSAQWHDFRGDSRGGNGLQSPLISEV